MSTCNKPMKQSLKSQKVIGIPKKRLLQEICNVNPNEEIVLNCIHTLFKTDSSYLWELIIKKTLYKDYINALYVLFNFHNHKGLLFEAYKTIIYKNYFVDTSDYQNIIFQCMMKINYLYDEKGLCSNETEIYHNCIDYIPTITNFDDMNSKLVYKYENEKRCIDINIPSVKEKVYFEKSMHI